jgi:hypothetical protein
VNECNALESNYKLAQSSDLHIFRGAVKKMKVFGFNIGEDMKLVTEERWTLRQQRPSYFSVCRDIDEIMTRIREQTYTHRHQ